jgi:hypothetical protein
MGDFGTDKFPSNKSRPTLTIGQLQIVRFTTAKKMTSPAANSLGYIELRTQATLLMASAISPI